MDLDIALMGGRRPHWCRSLCFLHGAWKTSQASLKCAFLQRGLDSSKNNFYVITKQILKAANKV